ncbi:unnamed protein product [Didymodactylos carnosus]|uniref:Uncharacterized protein n=1 Tax=Didymodactylos carnosus TaxID=1234261 RepID=A0A8S2FJP7_9BILA|nr:unnamed protein product [Didymodactylos carnosus]CAF4276776.1 unnamed protein product [Didymodactylos carnosus]
MYRHHKFCEQLPLLQTGVALGTDRQTIPHEPQFDVSVFPFTSHPFVELPSQFRYPPVHVIEQVPLEQTAVE